MSKLKLSRIVSILGAMLMFSFGSSHALSSPLTVPEWAKGGSVEYATVDNIKLRYLTVGEGEPLVLVHTIRTQLDYFRQIIPELSQHYKIYAVDLPGHGYSDIPGQAQTKAVFEKAVSGLLEQLDIQGVTLVGESIGGAIVLGVAGQQNQRVKRVVSLNPATAMVSIEALLWVKYTLLLSSGRLWAGYLPVLKTVMA